MASLRFTGIQLEHPFKARINVAELTWYYSWPKKGTFAGDENRYFALGYYVRG